MPEPQDVSNVSIGLLVNPKTIGLLVKDPGLAFKRKKKNTENKRLS